MSMRHHASVDDSGVFQPASATLRLAGIDETVKYVFIEFTNGYEA
jgi:hypothetical protein